MIPSSLVPRPPRLMGERRSGTVASNSWSKRQTSFPLKKDVHCNEWKRRLTLGPSNCSRPSFAHRAWRSGDKTRFPRFGHSLTLAPHSLAWKVARLV